MPLAQWLALTTPNIAADVFKLPLEMVDGLIKEKQVLPDGE